MLSNKIFNFTILISIIFHVAVLTQTLNLNTASLNKKEIDLKTDYVKEQLILKEKADPSGIKKQIPLKTALKIAGHRKNPPPFIDLESTFKISQDKMLKNPVLSKPVFIKPDINKPDIIAVRKKISLPAIPLDIQKINNQYYMTYYQTVREKIKRAAYQNYIHIDTGEVYMSFVISSDGSLKDAKIHEEKSQGSLYLKETALKSVSEASPFPPFPKELDYPQLTFNVIISFSIE